MKSREGIEWERFAMKKVDWTHWFTGCFQTVVWIGKSNPGQGAVRQQKTNNAKVSQRLEHWAAAVTAEATHDHKRGRRHT